MEIATVFFLPLKDRPKDLFPLKDFKGIFWHTGIVFNDKVYECFNGGRYSISSLDRLKEEVFKNVVLVKDVLIDEKKLLSEIKSGTSCEQYVARCTGLSDLKGEIKGVLYPEDVYNLLVKK